MAARNRFTITVRCPKCGRTEKAEVSEDLPPLAGNPKFLVDRLPGFRVVEPSDFLQKTKVACETCGTQHIL